MKKEDIIEFWSTKEKEAQSRLVIASFATYIEGYPGLRGPIHGLLYLMENGFYFENFEKKDMWSTLFQKNPSFRKTYLKVPIKSISEVSVFGTYINGQRIVRRIGNILRKKLRGITIRFLSEDNQRLSISFECIENPMQIYEKYSGLIKR